MKIKINQKIKKLEEENQDKRKTGVRRIL